MTRTRSASAQAFHPNKKPRIDPEPVTAVTETTQLDIQAFPHILDAVIDAAAPEVLRALRATNREIFRKLARRERHLSLEQMPEDLHAKRDEFYDWDLSEEERENRIPEPVWAVTRSGVRHAFIPDNTDVLDIDGWVSRLWFDIIEPNIGLWDKDEEQIDGYDTDDKSDDESDHGYHFGLPRRELTEQERKIRRWLRRNEEFFFDGFNPRLVRYPHGFDDHYRAWGPIHQNPCAVYFCDFSNFIMGLRHLNSHYNRWNGVRDAFFDTVFNVKLVCDVFKPNQWNDINPLDDFNLTLRTNALTVLFESTPEFVKSVENHWDDPLFLVGLLQVMTRNFIAPDEEDEDRPGEGKATIVGYDTWPLVALPDPSESDGRGTPTTAADCVRRWIAIHVADVKEMVREKGQKFNRPEAELDDPIRLLTLEEWRREIGEEYFRLMTDKHYQYELSKPLPPFKRHPSVEPVRLIGNHNAGDRWVVADGQVTLESEIDPANFRKIVQSRW